MSQSGAASCGAPCQRQRLVATAILLLLIAGTSPVVAHHVPLPLDRALGRIDHIGGVCVAALHQMLLPVHWSLHVLLVGGLGSAVAERIRAWRRLRRALAPLAILPPASGDPIVRAAVLAGLDPARLRVVRGLPNPVFTAGFVSPLVYVAEELAPRLSESELVAVLAHESVHVSRRDPLRLSLLRGLSLAFFWIPLVRRLAEDFADDAELVADDFAARQAGQLRVAAALVSLSSWQGGDVDREPLVAFRSTPLVARRVQRLLGEGCMAPSHVTRRAVMAAAITLGAVWGIGLLMAHPMPSDHGRGVVHCAHPTSLPFGHLFCKARHTAAEPCPHASGRAAGLLAGR
ncbi:MAG TPA: M56 family metallopeptidase [Gemmatimonadaceae bacterium]